MDLDDFADTGVKQTSIDLNKNLTIQQALKVFDDHWYALTYRSARWMDLIGDYGGSELFIIDGESLLQQVLDDPLLAIGQDGDCSFQILHAYYSLEQAILEFRRRSANFEIVFWQAYRHSTIKTGSSKFVVSSRLLARTMLFKHLMKIDGLSIHVFNDLGDLEWRRYYALKKPMFVMTSDGGVVDKPEELDKCSSARILERRLFLFRLLASGISFARLNGAEYREFKILTFVNEQNRNPNARKLLPPPFWEAASLGEGVLKAALPDECQQVTLSTRSLLETTTEDILIDLSRSVKKSDCGGQITMELLYLFLLHCVVLPGLTSSSRARPAHGPNSLSKVLTERFLPTVFVTLSQLSTDIRSCIDVDGRVFSAVISFASLNNSRSIPEILSVPDCQLLHSIWSQLRYPKPDLNFLYTRFLPDGDITPPQKTSAKTRSLLPFENEVFDSILSTVKVTVQNTEGHKEVFAAKYFNFTQGIPFDDDRHWHSQNSIISRSTSSSKPKKLGFYARRRALQRNQKFMQRLQDQAATLTGASGAILQQMVIPHISTRKVTQAVKDNSRINAKKKLETKLSSADKLRKEIQAEKATKQESEAQSWWKEHLSAMAKMSSTQKATHFQMLLKSKKSGEPYLHLEMQLYQIYLEFLQWIDEADHDSDVVRDRHTVAIVRIIKDLCDGPFLTLSAAKFLKNALRVIGLDEYIPTMIENHEAAPDKRLSFKPIEFISSKTHESHFPYMCIKEDPIFWQLRVFGEFMNRSMDGFLDQRVSFVPDAWQRTVLDNIDSNHSLLVVAPTSAGKTFISFYAMEKVLRESDDGILVYVAPTKALVTQVTAEIYARFSKTLANGSCWAIHTRDYRIHDPLHCQILVTVPEILVTMLLSPPMARNWTSRIKWIVLDEIHCVGQQEGGAVWEQIILFAPCPIIGLSATIGSPDLFNNWLQTVQEAHGFKHTFVQHPHRYSHLRKFYYLLDANRKSNDFSGLSSYQPTSSVRFLHPISMMSFGARVMPSDLALEARDTLTLYQALARHSRFFDCNMEDLEPRQFFAECKGRLLTQKEIITYETALKNVISPMFATFDPADSSSPIHRVLKDLKDPMIASVRDVSLNIIPPTPVFLQNLIYLVADLHAKDYLPAILFSFDRTGCEKMLKTLLDVLEGAERKWRQANPERNRKTQAQKIEVNTTEGHARREPKWKRDGDFRIANKQGTTGQGSSDLYVPVEQFSFANMKVYSQAELDEDIAELSGLVQPWILRALKRGIGVHHSGMNKGYRALVESLFRQRFVRVLISTGTLALGINAPAKTSVFVGDSPYLTALMYRQCSGRAGRRGYDLLGNVIFYGLTMDRVQRLVLSKLPTLGGNFPLTSTLVLRLCNLLHGSNNASVAVNAIRTISSLPSICFGYEVGRNQILHHLRFSIEYLRRSHLLDEQGKPTNLYAVAAHLYYTEPSNFAIVALMHSGILHIICAQNSDINARRDYIHLMSHLFGRRYISRVMMNSETMSKLIHTYPSKVVLPPLPGYIRSTLKKHDQDVLDIFTSYVVAYVEEHDAHFGMEDSLPLSAIRYTKSSRVWDDQAALNQYLERSAIKISARSAFVANSGHDDHFKSVSELARTVRQGVYLNQHAIPSMTHLVEGGTQEHELNAYLLDFYTHGQTAALIKANGIRPNDVWFLLEDFALTLSLMKAALEQLFIMNAKAIHESSEPEASPRLGSDEEDHDDEVESDSGYGTLIESHLPVDEDEANEKPENAEYCMKRPVGVSNADWKVYEVVSVAREEFMVKFKAMWA
ncbi:hypothetical protein APHAL10511_006648 [Amanita phalloides]|nr:hypothetical protein APHAL10511_006648 [Amanita phalloides]